MNYFDKKKKEAIDLNELKKRHKNVSFPISGPDNGWLKKHNYALIKQTEPPEINQYQKLSTEVELKNKQYIQKWEIKEIVPPLEQYRYEKETQGLQIGQFFIPTDRNTQSIFTALYIRAKEDDTLRIDFKTKDGFISLNYTQIIEIGDKIFEHVQKCFITERLLLTKEIKSHTELETLFQKEYNKL